MDTEKSHEAIDPVAARDVLGWAGLEGGWSTGGFTSSLIKAICAADDDHQARLALGFPELVHAVQVYQRQYGGVERLQAAARGEQE